MSTSCKFPSKKDYRDLFSLLSDGNGDIHDCIRSYEYEDFELQCQYDLNIK